MKEVIYICVLSIGSIFALFILTKLMGARQMSEMSMFDYINGITIGSIAAEMATSLEESFVQPLTAMIVYAVVNILLSWLCIKNMTIRRFVTGKPLVLLNQGILYEKNLKKAKIDVNEFLLQCRVNGYFDITKIQTAILEDNGKISFLPVETERPITPSDLDLSPSQEVLCANVVIDGKIMWENLRHTGKDETWLKNQLHAKGAKEVSDVILATVSEENQLNVFLKTGEEFKLDFLM